MTAEKNKNVDNVYYAVQTPGKLLHGGRLIPVPKGWEFVPAGDPALTRRLKLAAPNHLIIRRNAGRREINAGLYVPAGIAEKLKKQLQEERKTPEYQKKMDSARRHREKLQEQYEEDFYRKVLKFLNFHPRWIKLAEKLARVITDFTTPVGSGTVARTKLIPVQDRARAAVIAWMRHNTTEYDRMHIAGRKGRRREVRRELASGSVSMLKLFRDGQDVPPDCPLFSAVENPENNSISR